MSLQGTEPISMPGGFTSAGDSVAKTTDVHVEAYRLAHLKTQDRSVGEGIRSPTNKGKQSRTKNSPENRHKIQVCQRKVIDAARELEEASLNGESLDAGLAGMELKEGLRELWRLRKLRSDDWATVVNFLQASLANELFENIDSEKCKNIRLVIERHLKPTADLDDVDAAEELLCSVGFDPLKVFTGYRE